MKKHLICFSHSCKQIEFSQNIANISCLPHILVKTKILIYFSRSNQDCNRCRCAANGIGWFCTRRACPPPQRTQRQAPSPSGCIPGTTFKRNCNTCWCNRKILSKKISIKG